MKTSVATKLTIVVVVEINPVLREEINSQSLEDTQVGYISQKYTLENTLWKLRCGNQSLKAVGHSF